MTPFQIILLAVTIVMVVRQGMLIWVLAKAMQSPRYVGIRWSWWAHLYATVAFVVASVVSFTGVSS